METVGDRMTSPVLSIEQDESVKNAAEKIYANGIGSLLATSNENFIGIITKTDLMTRVLIKNLSAESIRVAEVMSQPIISIDASETLDSARKLLREKSIRHLAVTRDKEIVGILSIKTCNKIRLSFPLLFFLLCNPSLRGKALLGPYLPDRSLQYFSRIFHFSNKCYILFLK